MTIPGLYYEDDTRQTFAPFRPLVKVVDNHPALHKLSVSLKFSIP